MDASTTSSRRKAASHALFLGSRSCGKSMPKSERDVTRGSPSFDSDILGFHAVRDARVVMVTQSWNGMERSERMRRRHAKQCQ